MSDSLIDRLKGMGAHFWNGDKDERIAGMLMHDAAAELERTGRVVEAAVDAYRDHYSTITQNNLGNATRAFLGGEKQPRDHPALHAEGQEK